MQRPWIKECKFDCCMANAQCNKLLIYEHNKNIFSEVLYI